MMKTFTKQHTSLGCKFILGIYLFFSFHNLAYSGYQSNSPSTSFNGIDNSSCYPVRYDISNVDLTVSSRSNAALGFTVKTSDIGGTASFTKTYYASSTSISSSGGLVINFGTDDIGVYCTTTSNSIKMNAVFRSSGSFGGSSISGTLTISSTNLSPGSVNVPVTLTFNDFGSPSRVITISGITGTSACAGTTLSLTIRGSAPTTAVVVANVGGSQTQIGTVSSDNFFDTWGTINWTVPAGIANGTQIFFRVSALSVTTSSIFSAFSPVNPNLDISETLLCSAKQIALQITGVSGSLFVEGNNGWPSNSTTYNPTPQSSTTYTVTVQRRGNGSERVCPPVTVSKPVQVFTFNPSINPPSTTNKCDGEAIDLTASPNGGGSFNYTWTRDGQNAGDGQTIQGRQSGEYRVVVTPQGVNCPAKTSSNAIRLNFDTPIPDQDISPSKANRLICGAPDETSMQLTANPEGVSYNWRREGGGGLGNSRSISVSQGGRYVVDMQRGACFRSKVIDVQENSYDRNIAPLSATTFCADAPITLRANSNDANRFDYVWKKDGMNVGSNSPTYQTNVGGTFTVSITTKNTGCSPKTSDAVSVVASTPISDEAIALPAMKERPILCGAPDEPSIVLTAVQTDVSYNWQGPSVSNATQKTLTITQAGEYTLNMVRGACSKQKKITVEPNTYDTNIATAPPAFCSKTPITLRANSNDAAKFDYAWKRNGIAVGSNTPTLLLTNEVGSFKYTVEITSKGTGCKSKTSAEVSINTDRAITGAKITLPAGKERAIICGDPENAIVLTAVSDMPTDGIAFNWQGPTTGMANTLSAAQAGDYKVSFDRGTCQEEATVKVESGVFVPSISATGTIVNSATDLRICNGETSTITANISGTNIPNTVSNFTYRWFGGGDANTEITNQKGQTLPAVVAGTYRLEMTLTGSGCPKKDAPQRIKIAVDPAIKNPRITPNPAIICNKANGLTITALTDSSAGISYRWSGGGRSDSDPTKYIVSNAGNYSVTFSRGACQGQASVSPREEELKIDVAAPFMSNPIIVCEGSNSAVPVELKATANLSTATIKWMRNNGEEAPTPNTGGTYLPKQSGQYYATANFNNICNATSPQKVPIEALTNFSISISPSNPAPLCDDRPINLTPVLSHATYRDIYAYEWVQDGKNVKAGIGTAGNTLTTGKVVDYPNNTLVLGNESNYVVKITKDGCKAESAVSKITLKPARSTITVLDINTLEASTSGDAKYEWYYKNTRASSFSDSLGYQLLPNFTARTLLGADMGSYYVRANRNGCGIKNSFAHYVSVITASSPTFVNEWLVYPNPAVESIVVENQAKPSAPVEVRFWDSWGRELQHFSQDRIQERYSVGHLPAGVYYVEIKENGKVITKKIVKQ